jgi:hypothetical protein
MPLCPRDRLRLDFVGLVVAGCRVETAYAASEADLPVRADDGNDGFFANVGRSSKADFIEAFFASR